jgi:hypothetical protein
MIAPRGDRGMLLRTRPLRCRPIGARSVMPAARRGSKGTVSDLAYCANGHELWVERDESGEVTAAKESFARVYVDCSFCPKCGAEIRPDGEEKS